VVLIAGKGHETYQDGAAGKRPFDDLAVAHATLERISRVSRA
jgi:UDP-N-acetylmuramoyl-L-alanyl-D-glutamate--2,6-diaminopimelate ligase